MIRLRSGQTEAFAVTAAGSGTLTDETFTAYVSDQNGRIIQFGAEITDAAAREVTFTIPASSWRRGNGGYGRVELIMDDGSAKTVAYSERARILPGVSPEYAPHDYGE